MPNMNQELQNKMINSYNSEGVVKVTGLSSDSTAPIISKLLSSNGDGTGTTDLVGNYATPTDFYIQPSAGKILKLSRININVQDGGSLDSDSYGNGITLTNGVKFIVDYDGVEHQIGEAVITNSDYSLLAGPDVVPLTFGAGDQYLVVRWTFTKAGSVIRLTENDKFIVRLEDSYTGLTGHKFMVQGTEMDA